MITNNRSKLQPVNAQTINVYLTTHQKQVLKHYCARHGHSKNTVVLAALCAMIEGFEITENSVITADILSLK